MALAVKLSLCLGCPLRLQHLSLQASLCCIMRLVGDPFLRQACTCEHAMTMADRETSRSLETALIIAFRVGDQHACSAWRRADLCTWRHCQIP